MRSCILISVIFILGCNNKSLFDLKNKNFLIEISGIKYTVDGFTNAYPEAFFKKEDLFMSVNKFNHSVTIFDTTSNVIFYQDYSYLKKQQPRFNLSSGWFQNIDSIFIYSDNLQKLYLFNSKNKLIDTFCTEKKNLDKKYFYPLPEISTKQPAFLYKAAIFTTGFLGGEVKNMDINNRYIISRIKKDSIQFLGRYPDVYNKDDWGGFYFRHVYNTEVVDNKVYYSYPASSKIGVLNLENDSFYFKNTLPEIKNIIKPIPFKYQYKCVNVKNFLPKHFYSQYSFGPIIFDKFRNVFYRFLLKPTDKRSLEKDGVGPQPKFLITYDRNFEILGYNDLVWEYSNFNFFVTVKGLFIQKVKRNDENNMYFSLFTFNNSFN